jgi:glucose/arabinose dehydrogenase
MTKGLLVAAVSAALLLSAPQGALAATAVPLSPADLAMPAAFTTTPDGVSILYGERLTGSIKRLNPTTGTSTPFFTIPDVTSADEKGLLGLALGPSYPSNARVWAFVTRNVSGTARNQLLRISADGSGFAVLRSFPATRFHNGGRILFGPDGKLYVVLGERHNAALAQDLSTLAGKVLRLNPDGTVPSDNPVEGSPIIGYGIRNSFGFTFDPQQGRLWLTDNGDDCNDEIDLIARRTLRNYGWGPSASCTSPPPAPRNTNQDGESPVLPKFFLPASEGITGAAFCRACGLTSSGGQLFFAEFNTGIIHRARLTSDRLGIASQALFDDHPDFVFSVETPLDGGPIYFSTRTNIFRLDP